MADTSLNDEANHSRLSRLLIGKGTETLRKLFDTFYSSSTLRTFLNKHHALLFKLKFNVINEDQWDLLFPTSVNPDSKNFDISLLTVLLRNICGIKLPASGWSTMPPETDTTVEANIVRLRLYRNDICHLPEPKMADDKFKDLWSKISQVCIKLGVAVAEAEIEQLRDSPLSPEEQNYLEMLNDWKIQDDKMQKELDEVINSRRKRQKTTSEIAEDNKENKEVLKVQPDAGDNVLKKLFKFNFDGDIRKLAEAFHPGTREWLFMEVGNWLSREGTQVFVLTAGPGVGKSVLAAKIIEKYKEDEKLVACHFCKFNNSNYSKPLNMIQSLASQICDSVKGFREKLIEQLKKPNDVNNLQDAFQVYLKEPLQGLQQTNPKLVVIDGLDECERDGKMDLLEVLAEEFSKLPTWLKVFVTSRPELIVKEKISLFESIEILPTDENNEEDIKQYLTSQLSNLLDRENILMLTKTCEGLFLFAFHLQDHLRKLGDNITEEDIKNPLPKGIHTVYFSYFKRLEEQLRKISKQYEIQHLLRIIAVAYQPIPLSFFTEELELAPDLQKMKEIIRNVNETISNLLYVSYDSVTVNHKSVNDWLWKDHKYTVDFGQACVLLWKITENKFKEIKKKFLNETNGSNVCSFIGNTTMQHVLKHGFVYLFRAANYIDVGVNFEWLVDVSLLHAMTLAKFGFQIICILKWRQFLQKGKRYVSNNNESSSTMKTIRQKVSWNYKHFSKRKVRPIYVQDFFNEAPEEIFSDEEKREAKMILDNHQHFWCEKLGYLNLAAPIINHVTACAFSPDGWHLVSCAKDGRICIWNINSLQIVKEVPSNCKNATCCFWFKDKEILIYYHVEGVLMLSWYSVDQDSRIQDENVTTRSIAAKGDKPLAFSAQTFICKCSANSSIKVTRFSKTNQTTTCLPDLGCMHKIAVTRDGSSILAADKDHFEIWNASGTTSAEYNLAKSEKFKVDKQEHKNCDCIEEVLSCVISNNQNRGIISYFCSQSEEPNILVIDMNPEHLEQVDDTVLSYPTDEKLHFELIEGNNDDIVSSGDDDDNDEEDDDDNDDDNTFYFAQSYKRITVYSSKWALALTHVNHSGDPDYYKESPICHSGNMIALPQQSGGICMVKLHLPKTNEENFDSRIGHDFLWQPMTQL